MAYITLGYDAYVMPLHRAVRIAEWLAQAERYESKYHTGSSSSGSRTTYHVYPQDSTATLTVTLMGQAMYQIAKMAGKPDDK